MGIIETGKCLCERRMRTFSLSGPRRARIQCCKRQENDSQRWLLRRISCKSGTNFSAENLLGQIPAIAKTYAYVSRDTIFIALPSEIIEHVPTGESIGLDYFRNDVIACKAKHTMSRDYRENVSGNYTGETQICPLLGIAYVPEAEEEQREPGKKRFYLFTLATTGKLVFYSVDELGFEQEPIGRSSPSNGGLCTAEQHTDRDRQTTFLTTWSHSIDEGARKLWC